MTSILKHWNTDQHWGTTYLTTSMVLGTCSLSDHLPCLLWVSASAGVMIWTHSSGSPWMQCPETLLPSHAHVYQLGCLTDRQWRERSVWLEQSREMHFWCEQAAAHINAEVLWCAVELRTDYCDVTHLLCNFWLLCINLLYVCSFSGVGGPWWPGPWWRRQEWLHCFWRTRIISFYCLSTSGPSLSLFVNCSWK